MFNFENYLLQELHSDKVVVLSEQMFVKNGEFDSNKIYVVVKYGVNDVNYYIDSMVNRNIINSNIFYLQRHNGFFPKQKTQYPYRRYELTDNRSKCCTCNSHIACKNKDWIQNNICHSPNHHG